MHIRPTSDDYRRQPGAVADPPLGEPASPEGQRRTGGPHYLLRRFAPWLLWIGGALILLYLLDLASLHIAVSADGATALLEGQTMSGGNLALHGWALSLDSFWGIDASFYGLVVRFVGVHIDLLHFVPSLLAVLVICTGVALAREERRGIAGVIAALVVLAILGFPNPDLAYYLLQGPWHIGTALYCLLAFRALGRDRFGWEWIFAIVLLGVGLLSDLFILTFGVLPCLVAGIFAMVRCRRWRAGLTTLSAGFASIALALVVREILQLFGTFTVVNRNLVIRLTQIEANFRHLSNRIPGLFGVSNIPLSHLTNGSRIEELFHLVGLVIVALVLLVVVGTLIRDLLFPRTTKQRVTARSWRIDDLLLLAVIGDIGTFVTSSANGHVEFVKYLGPGVIFAVVLSARVIGRYVDHLSSQRIKYSLATGAFILTAIFASFFVSNLSRPNPIQPTQRVAQFLLAHHLLNGIGDYPTASLVTVDTGGVVKVRPVAPTSANLLERFNRQTTADWYNSTRFTFLVFNAAHPWHGVDDSSATTSFGKPAKTFNVGTYKVLVWSRPFSVSLGSPSYGSPLNIRW